MNSKKPRIWNSNRLLSHDK